jgi:hypothetical protein
MKALSYLPLALPLAAVPLLLATTSGETAIRSQGWVVLAAAILFAALAGTGGRKPRPWLDLPLAAVLGIAASHILFAPGLPRGHDTLHHLWGIYAVAGEAAAGSPAPLWVHGINLGTPLLQFYGPVAFLVSLPFSLAGLSPAAALKAAFLVFGAAAAMTQQVAVAQWTGDRRAGLVAAAAYAFAPYRLLDAHYRSAFGESAALVLLPLVLLFGMSAVREGGRRRMAVAAAAMALLMVTHPISSLMAGLALGIWTLAEMAGPARSFMRRIARLAGVGILGAALAGFFVVPFVTQSRHLVLHYLAQGQLRSFFLDHTLSPGQLVERRLWTRLQFSAGLSEPENGTDREMPFYFGLVLLSLLPLAAGLGRLPGGAGEDQPPARPPWGLLCVTAAGLALTTRPFAHALSVVLPPIGSLQFSWRFLGLATVGATALAGFAAARLLDQAKGRRWAAAVPGALAALLLFDAFPYTGAGDWYPSYREFGWIREQPGCGRPWGCWSHEPVPLPGPIRVAGMFVPPPQAGLVSLFCCAYTPEYMSGEAEEAFYPAMRPDVLARAGVQIYTHPATDRLERQRSRPYAAWWGGRGKPDPRRFVRGGGEIAVELDGRPGTVLVLEQYFPGWQVLTGEGWREVQPNWEGLLMAPVEAGQRVVQFRFHHWGRERTAGILLSALTGLGLLAWVRRRPQSAP